MAVEIISSEGIWALLGVFVGFVLSLFTGYITRKRENKSYWKAIEEEARLCSWRAGMFSTGGVQAPSYRLPSHVYGSLMPKLLQNNGIDPDEAQKLLLFYGEVDAINRGLDNAEKYREKNDKHNLGLEYKRTLSRAARIQGLAPDAQNFEGRSYWNDLQSVFHRRNGN